MRKILITILRRIYFKNTQIDGDMSMAIFEVGGKFTLLANRPEGTAFEITETGLIWIFNYNNPTDKEISDVSNKSPFEIRSSLIEGVLWVFVKCGDQKWAEAPYNPHLSASPALIPINNDHEGYALTLLMVDATTQTIRHIRKVGLGNKFSRQLKKDVDYLLSCSFEKSVYDMAIQKAQRKYTTAQMAKNARNYWKMR